ncbi:MAG: type IX secretion system membrane protein PorP/SprF [Bacteroidales bacterium]|nr:type IX secretion system membrane protein PorP/SprF [Bacteroidales bacterium]
MKKTIIIVIIALGFIIQAKSQQFSLYSQYMQNKYALNPAVAGSTDGINIGMSHRQLWTGLKGAPSIQNVYLHMPINDQMGIGAQVFNLTAGPSRKTGFAGTYAYHVKLNDNLKLSVGLSAIINQYYLDKSALDMKIPDDPILTTGSDELIVPDATFGTYLYGKKFYVGLIASQLIPLNANFKNDILENKQERHYFIHSGYNFKISDNFAIEPSVLGRFIETGIYQVDANLKFNIMNVMWIGGSYRLDDAVVGMIGVKVENIHFGYSYDYTLSDIGNYSNGSHEIVIIFNFGRKNDKSML